MGQFTESQEVLPQSFLGSTQINFNVKIKTNKITTAEATRLNGDNHAFKAVNNPWLEFIQDIPLTILLNLMNESRALHPDPAAY